MLGVQFPRSSFMERSKKFIKKMIDLFFLFLQLYLCLEYFGNNMIVILMDKRYFFLYQCFFLNSYEGLNPSLSNPKKNVKVEYIHDKGKC